MKKFSPKTAKVCSQSANESALSELKQVFQNVHTKADVLRAILHEEVLRRIPIEQAPSVSKEQAEKDFRRERVILNGVFFIPDKIDIVRCEAFALSLHHLVERLEMQENGRASSSSSPSSTIPSCISDTILQRGCRTSAGADSFFMVQKLLCVEGTFVTQKTSLSAEDPIIVDVFLTYHERLDMESALNSAESSRASTNSTIDHRSDASHSSRCSCDQCLDNKEKVKEREKERQGERKIEIEDDKDNPDIKTTEITGCHRDSAGDIISEGIAVISLEYPINDLNSIVNEPELSRARSSLFARIEVKNFFSVYDISAMDELPRMSHPVIQPGCGSGGGTISPILEQPVPWLEVQTILIDESNFRTKEHWRRIQLIVTVMSGQPNAPHQSSGLSSPMSSYSMSP